MIPFVECIIVKRSIYSHIPRKGTARRDHSGNDSPYFVRNIVASDGGHACSVSFQAIAKIKELFL